MSDNKCRSCGAPIEWAMTEKGKRIPIDKEPVEDGNIALSHRMYGQPPVAIVQNAEQIARLHSESAHLKVPFLLFKSHFATCPQSGKWRRK